MAPPSDSQQPGYRLQSQARPLFSFAHVFEPSAELHEFAQCFGTLQYHLQFPIHVWTYLAYSWHIFFKIPVWDLERLQTAEVTFEITKVIRLGATYDFLLVYNGNYVSVLYYFRDMITYLPKFKEGRVNTPRFG